MTDLLKSAIEKGERGQNLTRAEKDALSKSFLVYSDYDLKVARDNYVKGFAKRRSDADIAALIIDGFLRELKKVERKRR